MPKTRSERTRVDSVTLRTTLISRRETSEPASRRDYTAELVKCGRDVGPPAAAWLDRLIVVDSIVVRVHNRTVVIEEIVGIVTLPGRRKNDWLKRARQGEGKEISQRNRRRVCCPLRCEVIGKWILRIDLSNPQAEGVFDKRENAAEVVRVKGPSCSGICAAAPPQAPETRHAGAGRRNAAYGVISKTTP